MKDNEMKDLWKSLSEFELISYDKEMLNKEVTSQCASMDNKIKRRNILEITVAIMLMPTAAFVAYLHQDYWVKAGAILMIPYLIWVIYKLRQVRNSKPINDPQSDNITFLKQSLSYYKNEKHLLETVPYWYVLPLFLCVTLIMIGMDLVGFQKYYAFAVMVGMTYAISRLNQLTVIKKINPLIEQIQAKLQSVEE